MKSAVYAITNMVTGRLYIGSSVNANRRLQQHKTDLRGNRHSNDYLQNSWNKHGQENFSFEIIEYVAIPELRVYEQRLLDIHKSNGLKLFNIRPSAEGVFTFTVSESTKRKISESKMGSKHTDETRKAMSEARTGRNFSKERNLKIAATKTGSKHTQATKEKMSKSQKRRFAK